MPTAIAARRVVYQIAGMEEAPVRRGIAYRDTLRMDIYYPREAADRVPAVVMALGYPDVAAPLPLGRQYREMGMAVSWAQLIAASGMAAVLYETPEPASDIHAVLAFLRQNAQALRIDPERTGVWAASGHSVVALDAMIAGGIRCGALLCGYLLDLNGATGVADDAAQYHFANPTAGRTVEEFPRNVPLFIARAGNDPFPGVNQSIDAFVSEALRLNLPVTLVNHATGVHGFDLFEDSDASRGIVRAVLGFLRTNLGIRTPRSTLPGRRSSSRKSSDTRPSSRA